jgi:sec-independent protein translocase protein TatA
MFEGLLQPMHLVIILGLALLFFGPKKLAERGKEMVEGFRGLKDSLNADNAAKTPQTPPKERYLS